jgi:hypothetical protein
VDKTGGPLESGLSAAATLTWAFGLGNKWQTYLYSQTGSWYESRVSFYNTFHSGGGDESGGEPGGEFCD